MDDWAVSAIIDVRTLGRIIGLSLAVSISATTLAALLGTPLGAALAVCHFPGRRILVVTFNALLGLPPMVVGLALYLLLSRSGPLGSMSLLNRYDVILLDPKKHPEAKQEPARRFADWLASPEGQAAIGDYKINGEALFHPSANSAK